MKRIFSKMQFLYLTLAIGALLFAVTSHILAYEVPAQNSLAQAADAEQMGAGGTETPLLSGQVGARIQNLGENVRMRMQAAVDRLQHIATRLEKRIALTETNGVNVETARAAHGRALQTLSAAKGSIEALGPELSALIVSETPRETFRSIKVNFLTVRDQLREAHGYLRDAVNELKQPRTESSDDLLEMEETPTTATNTSTN